MPQACGMGADSGIFRALLKPVSILQSDPAWLTARYALC